MPRYPRIAIVALILSVQSGLAREGAAPRSLAQFSESLRSLTRKASPSVVEIEVDGYGISDDGGGSADQVHRIRSSASGVVVDATGYIMTNAHVVAHASAISVLIGWDMDGTRESVLRAEPARSFPARVVGMDRQSDLALVKIDSTGLPALTFGNSDNVSQGDVVLAIGSPLQLRNSLSIGVVSAPARAIGDDDPILYIQTDAPLNPGNSGGALIDIQGRLIGLNTSILSESGGNEGIGFAIPSNLVDTIYRQLRATGAASHGDLGVRVQSISPMLARALSLEVSRGVLVADVDPHGPGYSCGLERDDVILSINDRQVYTARQFNDAIYGRRGGEKIRLRVQRGEEAFTLTAKVSMESKSAPPLSLLGSVEESLISPLGIFCLEVNGRVLSEMPELRTQYGLLVVAILAESPAKSLDLKPGDVIHELNSLAIATLDAFRKGLDQFHKGDAVALQIERDGHFHYAAFEIE